MSRNGSIGARSRALCSIAADAASRDSVRMKEKCRWLEGRVALTSLRCHCNFWTPRNGSWRRSVVSSPRENTILEARSMLCDVRYAL